MDQTVDITKQYLNSYKDDFQNKKPHDKFQYPPAKVRPEDQFLPAFTRSDRKQEAGLLCRNTFPAFHHRPATGSFTIAGRAGSKETVQSSCIFGTFQHK